MENDGKPSLKRRLKNLIIGRDLDLADKSIFHKISLIAFFAWVGLGADGLSSSCYGPAEAYLALGEHSYLAVFVALASALTITTISLSYAQIIELFPTGGGGYIMASKLLSPTLGMVSGCALLIDYVLTIALSLASGADAVFSFLPVEWRGFRLGFAVLGVVVMTLLNLRGVKESIVTLVPIFMTFVITHVLVLGYGLLSHLTDILPVVERLTMEVGAAKSELGMAGLMFILFRAYSMGAGTYTGLEAVSNGLPILREPKARTGKRTMMYMAISLSLTVVGLILAFLLFRVSAQPGKTLNAVLFESITQGWPRPWGYYFVLLTLVSEALLLYVAAQAGFVDGPRVLANMALDRWMPNRFALLSDRLVTQNGILLMGGLSLILMLATDGAVDLLLVLYSINVFITFVLSQLGMVRHWWTHRGRAGHWKKKLAVNGVGLALTSFILATVVIVKFDEGGWVTVLITSGLIVMAWLIKRHYRRTGQLLRGLEVLVKTVETDSRLLLPPPTGPQAQPRYDPQSRTAVILVNGYNGLGLHTVLNVLRLFGNEIRSFLFVQVAVVDAGVFKGPEEIEKLKAGINKDLDRYLDLMRGHGCWAEARLTLGIDVVHEVMQLVPSIKERYPRAVFVGGQVVFENDSIFTRLLHNYVTFSLQRQLYFQGIPFVILPIRVWKPARERARRLFSRFRKPDSPSGRPAGDRSSGRSGAAPGQPRS
ncbi:MAG: APC family permease [Thermodesulfobacteriota bacterium]